MSKKILFVNTGFEMGGTEMFFVTLSEQFKKLNFTCDFLSIIDSYPLLLNHLDGQSEVKVMFPNLKQKPSFQRVALNFLKVNKILRDGGYDALMVGLYLPALPLWLSNFLFRKYKIFFFLLQTPDFIVRHGWFWNSGLMLRSNTYIIALSNYLKNAHLKLFPKYLNQFRVCPLPVDTTRFYPRNQKQARELLGLPLDKKILGACCRFSEEKGIEVMLQTMKSMSSQDVLMVFYGEGPMLSYMVNFISSNELGDTVKIYSPRVDTEIIYNALDIYFQAGYGSHLGLSTLEAFATGIPNVTVTRCEEDIIMAQETYLGYDAGVIVNDDPINVAHEISALLESPQLSIKKVCALQLAQEQYNWQTFMAGLIKLL